MKKVFTSGTLLLAALLSFAPTPRVDANSLHIIFAGDTYFGENYNIPETLLSTGNTPGLYDKSIEGLSGLLLSADWTVVNLETPLTPPLREAASGKGYIHWADPEKTAETLVRHGISSAGLANNHILDFGVQGLQATIRTLREWGIPFSGAGMNAEEAGRPLEKTFSRGGHTTSLLVFTGFEYRESYDEVFDFYATCDKAGVALLLPFRIAPAIQKARLENPDTLIVAYPHWGPNYRWRSKKQRDTAYSLIDAGADIVIGHGAHMFQEIERYKGKLIVYSLGNFVFNSPGRYNSKKWAHPYSLIARIVIPGSGCGPGGEIRLYPTLTDNLRTGYSSRFVTSDEFREVLALLEKKTTPAGMQSLIEAGADGFGLYLRLPLGF